MNPPRITIAVDRTIHSRFKKKAIVNDENPTQLINQFMKFYLKKKGKAIWDVEKYNA